MAKHFTFRDDEIVEAYGITKEMKQKVDAIRALLETDNPIALAILLAEGCALEYAKGKTEVACLSPKMANLVESNPEFFQALSEEGVLEWIAPLVLGKTTQAQ